VNRQLSKFSIQGLLGEFDHTIRISNDQDIIILYGPNGVGKTHVLKFIHHALRGEWMQIQELSFATAALHFTDGTKLLFSFELSQTNLHSDSPRRRASIAESNPPLLVKLITNEGEMEWQAPSVDFSDTSPMLLRRLIERDLGYRRIDTDVYAKTNSDERFTFTQAIAEESRAISRILSNRYLDSSTDLSLGLPDRMNKFVNSSASTMIETQRLIMSTPLSQTPRDRTAQTLLAIDQVSKSIQTLMEQALADNSRLSQRLDRTFPGRLFESETTEKYVEIDIRRIHLEQQEFRARLAEYQLGGVDESNVELPQRPLETWEIAVLGRYLRDSDQKLSSFKDLLERLDLFIQTLNSRFFRKTIRFSSDRSLEITSKSGVSLEVSQLSSGEQHEIILLKYLLFDANQNSLVLIDEPEISLHVSWQKAFLSDLSKISMVSNLRFIIATHSPQIINNAWDLAVQLGGNSDEW